MDHAGSGKSNLSSMVMDHTNWILGGSLGVFRHHCGKQILLWCHLHALEQKVSGDGRVWILKNPPILFCSSSFTAQVRAWPRTGAWPPQPWADSRGAPRWGWGASERWEPCHAHDHTQDWSPGAGGGQVWWPSLSPVQTGHRSLPGGEARLKVRQRASSGYSWSGTCAGWCGAPSHMGTICLNVPSSLSTVTTPTHPHPDWTGQCHYHDRLIDDIDIIDPCPQVSAGVGRLWQPRGSLRCHREDLWQVPCLVPAPRLLVRCYLKEALFNLDKYFRYGQPTSYWAVNVLNDLPWGFEI